MAVGDLAVDEQRLGRPADPRPPHLGVEHDVPRHVPVGGLVDVDVADAVEMRDHRHAAFVLHALDQALAAARHDDVDPLRHGEHGADRSPVGRRHELDGGLRQSGGAQSVLKARSDRARGMKAFGAAAQDGGVARLQAQPARIRRHVRPRFVDDPDDPERCCDARDLEPVRPLPFGERAPHWLG